MGGNNIQNIMKHVTQGGQCVESELLELEIGSDLKSHEFDCWVFEPFYN
jgi:hypothetical protein